MDRTPFEEILELAASLGASRVLFLAGQPPVYRIGRALQPPLPEPPLHFLDTEAIASRLLEGRDGQVEQVDDNLEVPFVVRGVKGRATIFFAQGAHNVVFYLDEGGPAG